jgi:methionyl aminopeptidase
MRRHGVRSAPKHEYGFPGFVCISVNDEIVHGIPGSRRLLAGDVVKIDVTAEGDGYVADAARTVFVGVPSRKAHRLRASAIEALRIAIAAARAGRPVSAIGRAVEQQARADGFSVIRELCGHGVGRRIHEPPNVPNYAAPWSQEMLTEGLVIAIEPMLAETRCHAVQCDDRWTIRTSNGALAVHQEHTVVIQSGAPLILTTAA